MWLQAARKIVTWDNKSTSSDYNVCRPRWWRRLTAGFRKNIEMWLLVINFLIHGYTLRSYWAARWWYRKSIFDQIDILN